MKLKKIALVALAVVLIAGLSVAGTMALLMQKTEAVTNTFQAYDTDPNTPLAKIFTLKESVPTVADDGTYEIKDDAEKTEAGVTYKIMPGMVVPKDPFVTIGGKTKAPARLFVEVVGQLPEKCTWRMESNWVLVDGLTGFNGGKVYVWNAILAGENANDDYPIIEGNKITVANDAVLPSEVSLTFYAYLAQATVLDATGNNTDDLATIYNACFPKP